MKSALFVAYYLFVALLNVRVAYDPWTTERWPRVRAALDASCLASAVYAFAEVFVTIARVGP